MTAQEANQFCRSKSNFEISTSKERVDTAAVLQFLQGTYWASDLTHDLLLRSIQGSLCFGVYCGTQQIGFARVITDRATFAYLCDVFVIDSYQGQGIGKWLVASILEHSDLQGLRRFMLFTGDAHQLYAGVGFQPLEGSQFAMEIYHGKCLGPESPS